MPYDLFISYSREDNKNNRVTELKEKIEAEYVEFTGEELNCFFDHKEIKGMDDWRQRLLKALNESKLFLLILSPNYIESDYCGWEIIEYLKFEYARATHGEGIAQVYFMEITGLDREEFETKAKAWLEKVNRRQRFDFRPWYEEGMDALKRADIKKRLNELKVALRDRILRMRAIASSPTNLPSPNVRFVGRHNEMKLLHDSAGLGKFGVITAIHGMGGLGKTAIAFQYAYAYAAFYPGGRWYIGCAGESKLTSALKKLGSHLEIIFTEEEKKDDIFGAIRVINELKRVALKAADESQTEIPATLVLFDNVDNAEFMQSSCIDLVSGKEWLKLVITTRLGPEELGKDETRQKLIAIDELPFEDAVSLIESHMPGEMFPNEKERENAGEIVKLLGCFTLAIEVAAKYLQERNGRISCADFLELLKREGELPGIEYAGTHAKRRISIDHSKLISATLAPTLDMLAPAESLTLNYAAILPPDAIPVQWIRDLCKENHPEIARDAPAGMDDPWLDILNHLLSLKIFQVADLNDGDNAKIRTVRMHRLVRQLIVARFSADRKAFLLKKKLAAYITRRSDEISSHPVNKLLSWELYCLFNAIQILVADNYRLTEIAAHYTCSALRDYGRYTEARVLAETAINAIKNQSRQNEKSLLTWFHNLAGVAALNLSEASAAELHFREAEKNSIAQGANELDWLDTLTNIGCFYRETYRPQKALKYQERALVLSVKKFGPNSPQVALRSVNLGLVLRELSKPNDAIKLIKKAIEIEKQEDGLTLALCQDMNTLAEILIDIGQLEKAEEYIQQAQSIIQSNGYEKHPVSINNIISMATLFDTKELYEEARVFHESALDLTIFCFGAESPQRAVCYNNLGVNSLLSGNIANAITELKKSLETELGRAKPIHQKLAHRELIIGIAYLLLGDYKKSGDHLLSGWNYKLKTGLADLLMARLLLVRFALSLIRQEKYDEYLERINSLIKQDLIPVTGIAYTWVLGKHVRQKIKELCARDQFLQWESSYTAIDQKVATSFH